MGKVVVERCLFEKLPKRWQKVAIDYAVDGYQTIENENETGNIVSESDPCIMEYVDDFFYWVEEDRFGRQNLCKEGRW